MLLKNYNIYFFMLVLLVITFLAFLTLKPFLTALLVASVLAITFYRPYEFIVIKTGGKKALSSILVCFVAFLMIILPIVVIFNLLSSEATHLYQEVVANNSSFQQHVGVAIDKFSNLPGMRSLDRDRIIQELKFTQSAQKITDEILFLIEAAYQNVVGFVIFIFVTFFSLYYFLIEGKHIIKRIMYLSPLKDEHEIKLSAKFVSMTKATLKGTVIVGVVQGLCGGVMFAIAGVQSYVIWGLIMAVFSVIPAIGTGIVWVPAGIIMLLMGNIWQGIFILLFGGLFISIIDNVLRPELVGNDTEMHPLLVFFATLGGLITFGALGFIIGPIIMALFLTLWDIYGTEFRSQLNKFNQDHQGI